jgi:hypothetical protein
MGGNTTGGCNTAVGGRALNANTIGINNTAVGQETLCSNTTGINNTAIGACSLFSNVSGACNTAVGEEALRNNAVGNFNTALGYQALFCNIASCNTAVGFCSLRCNTSGFWNTALGWCSLPLNSTGNSNTAIGVNTLAANTTGLNNIAIGVGAQCSLAQGINDTIAVGCGALTSSTNGHTVWGTAGVNCRCNCVYVAWSLASDCRDKTNIQTLSPKMGLDLIKKLRPVAFNWDYRDTYVRECSYEYGKKDGTLTGAKEHYGLIAQELKQTLDELNVKFDGLGHDPEKDAYRITYEELIAPIIKAIQELNTRLEVVEEKVG